MRRLAVLVAVSVMGCSFAMQGVPKDRSIESTFPKSPPVAKLPNQFKVVTFNIYKQGAAKVAKGIAGDRDVLDADLITLQEVFRSNATCSVACELGRKLGYYSLYVPGHHVDGRDYGVALLSKAPITSAQLLVLPANDVHFNAGRRVALMATVQHASGPITVYSVHLENRLTVAARRRQMLPILKHAQQQKTPVVIAGDFNTNPFTWISHTIPILTNTQDERLEELVRAHGFDTPVTESGATHRYIGMKLDAIYTRGFETKRFATAYADEVSDHMALWATMTPKQTKTAPTKTAPTRTVQKSVATTSQ